MLTKNPWYMREKPRHIQTVMFVPKDVLDMPTIPSAMVLPLGVSLPPLRTKWGNAKYKTSPVTGPAESTTDLIPIGMPSLLLTSQGRGFSEDQTPPFASCANFHQCQGVAYMSCTALWLLTTSTSPENEP